MFNFNFNDFKSKIIIASIPFFLVLLIQNIFPSSPTGKEIEDMVMKGLDKTYNFKWNDAEQIFTSIIDKFPQDPRGYHYKSSIYLWYYLSSKNDEEYENFLKYSDLAIDKGDELLEKEPDNKDLLEQSYTQKLNITWMPHGQLKNPNYI